MACFTVWDIGACGCSAPSGQIFVEGCYYSAISLGAAGVTVTVNTYPGGMTVASGATDATGTFDFTLPTSGARYTVIVSGARWTTSTTTPVLTAGVQYNCSINANTTYICTFSCGTPLAKTLHCTFANAGPQTFTFSSSTYAWTASFTYLGTAYVINLPYDVNYSSDMSATAGGTAFYPVIDVVGCPTTPGLSGDITCNDPGNVLGNAVITE